MKKVSYYRMNCRLWDTLLCKMTKRNPASNGVPAFKFALSDSNMFDSQKMQIRKRVIPKRIVTKIGNIFGVEIDNEYKCFFQYIANDMTELNSSVIRVFKKHYSMDYIPNMDEIVQDEVYFYAYTILSRGIRAEFWYKVGKNADVGDVNKIMFRDTEDFGAIPFCRKSSKWYVWHIGGPTSYIGRLTKETRTIDLGYIWNNTNIIAKIKTGKFLLPEIL